MRADHHAFNTQDAAEHGILEAVLIHHFSFWVAKNEAEGEHFHEGRYWTYNSVKAMAALFPYVTTKQLRYAIDNLVTKGVLLKGNFNKNAWDRTTWFAFAKIGESSSQPGPISFAAGGKSLTTPDINQMKEGADASAPTPAKVKKPRAKRDPLPMVTLKTWLETIKAKGEMALPPEHSVFEYAEKVKMPQDYVALAWKVFKNRYTATDSRQSKKRYKDWRLVFLAAVKENWLKLWWWDAKTGYALTTAGAQSQLEHASVAEPEAVEA